MAPNTNLISEYKIELKDYREYLTARGIPFKVIASRLVIGNFISDPEWLLYISVVKSQLTTALELLSPLLLNDEIAIAIPENNKIHGMILEGHFGFAEIGKVVVIHVSDQSRLQEIASLLVHHTKILDGPVIPAGIKLGKVLFTDFNIPSFDIANNRYPSSPSKWPFNDLATQKKQKTSKFIGKHYLITSTIKSAPKGNVYKALDLNNWLNIKWCVIKEGRNHQCVDEYGRSIIDRLKWQKFVHQQFKDKNILPHVSDFLSIGDNAYLVMEYVEGMSYNDQVSEIQEGVLYRFLSTERKQLLIELMIQLIGIIEKFHTEGYLHRDISPMNFMIDKTGGLIAIDVELAFNFKDSIPNPWFTLGTKGYMSNAQTALHYPKIEDDIYGLGGMLIRTLTGVSPIKFERLDSSDSLYRHLNYFINDHRLVSLLVHCRENIPSLQPAIPAINHTLEIALATLLTINKNTIEHRNFDFELKPLIERGIIGLTNKPFIEDGQYWYTKPRDADGQSTSLSLFTDLYGGISGVQYLLYKLEFSSYDIGIARTPLEISLHQLVENAGAVIENGSQLTGIFAGHSGIALTLAQLINDGQLERNISNINTIVSLLKVTSGNLSIDDGLAGTGLIMIKISRLLRSNIMNPDLQQLANVIIKQQRKDGSWYVNEYSKKNKDVIHGLLHGIAGVAYFLLVFGHEYENHLSQNAARVALEYLEKKLTQIGDVFHIPPSVRKNHPNPWIENGFTGIAYVFIRAYEYEKLEKFKEISIKLLSNHPLHITSNYISHANGITGLGEIYLEAWRVFKDDLWKERALHIGAFLTNSFCCTGADGIYWLDGNDSHPLPGFMNGNSGILHFLARLNDPINIDFPFLHIGI